MTADGRIDAEGEALDLQIAADVRLETSVRIRGARNALTLESGVSAIAFASSGFAATVPDPGVLAKASITIEGDDNSVFVGVGTRLGLNLTIRGNGHRVWIGPNCHLHGFVNLLGSGSDLSVGAGTTMVQGSLQLHEAGEIKIGADCMISSQVYVSLSDIHPIYDRVSGQRLNPAASIAIGDHVWLGLRCMVMKGAHVGDGAVIAAGALVSGQIPADAIAAGMPAKVIRRDIEWRRDFSQGAPEPTGQIMSMPRKKHWGLF